MYVSCTVSEVGSIKEWHNLEIGGKGGSRSPAMATFDRYDLLLVCHCKYSSILYHFRVIWRQIILWPEIWVRGHSRSLETAPFESLGMISYSSRGNDHSPLLGFFWRAVGCWNSPTFACHWVISLSGLVFLLSGIAMCTHRPQGVNLY